MLFSIHVISQRSISILFIVGVLFCIPTITVASSTTTTTTATKRLTDLVTSNVAGIQQQRHRQFRHWQQQNLTPTINNGRKYYPFLKFTQYRQQQQQQYYCHSFSLAFISKSDKTNYSSCQRRRSEIYYSSSSSSLVSSLSSKLQTKRTRRNEASKKSTIVTTKESISSALYASRIEEITDNTAVTQQKQQQQQQLEDTLNLPLPTIQKKIWMFRNVYPIAYEIMHVQSKQTTKDSKNDNDIDTTTTTIESNGNNNNIPILFLNGFGMGSFHQHRLMKSLAIRYMLTSNDNSINDNDNDNDNSSYTLYGIDYLGQGSSWPINCNDGISITEIGLQYSGILWIEQIISFIDQCILQNNNSSNNITNTNKKILIVGNSIGGHLATYIAAKRPDIIHSIILLNPTPVWGLQLPGWDGVLPAPTIPKFIGRQLFNLIRSPYTIRTFLHATYVHQSSWDTNININDNSNNVNVVNINSDNNTTNAISSVVEGEQQYHRTFPQLVRDCTEGLGGHAAFASILWSKPISITIPSTSTSTKTSTVSSSSSTSNVNITTISNFYDCLQYGVQCNVLLCFGTDDPWCKPILAKRMCDALEQRKQRYTQQQQQQNQQQNQQPAPIHQYVEIQDVGHCPNHEAPNTTSYLINKWITKNHRTNDDDADSNNNNDDVLLSQPLTFKEQWGNAVVSEKDGSHDIPLSFLDRLVINFI